MFTPFSAQVPELRFNLDRIKAERLDVSVADVFTVLQANLGGFYVNDFNLYGKVWKVIIQAEGKYRVRPADITGLYVLNRKKDKVPLSALGDVKYALGAIDVPHYNMYNCGQDHGPAGSRVQLGPGDRRHGTGGRHRAPGRFFL